MGHTTVYIDMYKSRGLLEHSPKGYATLSRAQGDNTSNHITSSLPAAILEKVASSDLCIVGF